MLIRFERWLVDVVKDRYVFLRSVMCNSLKLLFLSNFCYLLHCIDFYSVTQMPASLFCDTAARLRFVLHWFPCVWWCISVPLNSKILLFHCCVGDSIHVLFLVGLVWPWRDHGFTLLCPKSHWELILTLAKLHHKEVSVRMKQWKPFQAFSRQQSRVSRQDNNGYERHGDPCRSGEVR